MSNDLVRIFVDRVRHQSDNPRGIVDAAIHRSAAAVLRPRSSHRKPRGAVGPYTHSAADDLVLGNLQLDLPNYYLSSLVGQRHSRLAEQVGLRRRDLARKRTAAETTASPLHALRLHGVEAYQAVAAGSAFDSEVARPARGAPRPAARGRPAAKTKQPLAVVVVTDSSGAVVLEGHGAAVRKGTGAQPKPHEH
jgi:hypothetical protein